MSEDLTKILTSATRSASNLLSLLEDAQKNNERLNVQLNAQKRKYKALKSVLETLKMERSRDRQTIAKWQSWIQANGYEFGPGNQNPPKSSLQNATHRFLDTQTSADAVSSPIVRETGIDELPTSTGSNIGSKPSSDISDYPFEGDVHPVHFPEPNLFVGNTTEPRVSLSQRLLPTSIDLDELQGDSFSRSQDSLISSSPPPSPESESLTAPQHSQRTYLAPASKKIKREDSDIAHRVEIDESTSLCEGRLIWLRDLTSAQWHPSDFKLEETDSQEIPAVRGSHQFNCKQGRRDSCKFCQESDLILEEMGVIYAESRPNYGPESQETPAGFWRVDYLNSSQVRADKRQNEEIHQFEGKQRLVLTLLQKRYSFRDRNHQQLQHKYMN